MLLIMTSTSALLITAHRSKGATDQQINVHSDTSDDDTTRSDDVTDKYTDTTPKQVKTKRKRVLS